MRVTNEELVAAYAATVRQLPSMDGGFLKYASGLWRQSRSVKRTGKALMRRTGRVGLAEAFRQVGFPPEAAFARTLREALIHVFST